MKSYAQDEAPASKYLVVEESDWSGKVTLEVKSDADYNQLQKQIKQELSLKSKALSAAEKSWRADKELAKTPFPSSAIKTRTAKSLGTFPSKEKADAKMKELNEERNPKSDDGKSSKKSSKNANKNQPKKTKQQEDAEKKRLERQGEQELNELKAVGFFTEKLQELKQPPAEKAAS